MSTYDPELRRDTPLASALKERIRSSGPISVDEYMAACLYDGEHGYYRTRNAIGSAGDFVTAPEVSQIFGELIGLWSAVVRQQLGPPGPWSLIELGPGRGTLMADALRAAGRTPGFSEGLAVGLVETSRTMRGLQEASLARSGAAVTWHETISEISFAEGPAIVIGNEFLDCEPREQFVRRGKTWQRRCVGVDPEDRLMFVESETIAGAPWWNRCEAARDGDIFEPTRHASLLELAATRRPDVVLLIDYGYTAPAIGDTLQAVRRHIYEHPLTSAGEADLTMQVDFSLLAETAAGEGWAVDGPVTQAEWLGSLGILERASRLMSANPGKAAAIEAGTARLLSPNGMGGRFKVVALRSPSVAPLPGFPATIAQK